jgi:hypothetical protein
MRYSADVPYTICDPVVAKSYLPLYSWLNGSVDIHSGHPNIYFVYILPEGARGSVVVKALRYKPEGRGFDSRLGGFLNLPNLSGRTRPWGLLSL